MDWTQKTICKLQNLLEEIPDGIAKEEVEECIHRIQLRSSGEHPLSETSKLVYDALLEDRMDSIRNANLGFYHTPVIGDNTRINRDSFYNYISSSEKEASFISSSNLTSIKISCSNEGIHLKTKQGAICIPKNCRDPKAEIHSFIRQFTQQTPSFSSSFDADRLPGMGIEGGSLMGPESFRQKGYFGSGGNPVSPSVIPPGARFDPFRPGPPPPSIPSGVMPPRRPMNPTFPPFSAPTPDHLRKPDYYDLY